LYFILALLALDNDTISNEADEAFYLAILKSQVFTRLSTGVAVKMVPTMIFNSLQKCCIE